MALVCELCVAGLALLTLACLLPWW
jgi:hypothetical protein